MGNVLYEELGSWQDGILSHPQPDLIPHTATPLGKNSWLRLFGVGVAIPSKRKGATLVNATAISGTPATLGQHDYRRQASGVFTNYHLIVSANGRLDFKDSDSSTAQWDAGTAAPFSSGTYIPDFATAGNSAYICNGQASNNFKAYLESSTREVRGWGLTRPTVATMAGAAGAAGSPNGTYELRVTYYSSHIGHESSASDTATATVTVVNQRIDVSNIPVSSDAQTTERRIYLRNTSTMNSFRRSSAMVVANNSGTTLTINVADSAMTLLAPDTAENDPPPTLSVCEWHQSRMFAFGPGAPSHLLYSKLGLPEAFDPEAFERINPDDGQKGTALHSADEVLLIFKRDALYVLDGDDPASWQVRLLDPEVGCTAHQSVVTIDGITYWWSEHGPVAWAGGNRPTLIGIESIGNEITSSALNFAHLDKVSVAVDKLRYHLLFCVPGAGETTGTKILAYNYRLHRWVGVWDLMETYSLATIENGTTGLSWVFLGGLEGQLFRLWDGDNDGIPSGTRSGTFAASAASISTITDVGAAFVTTGGALTERVVRLYNSTSGAFVAAEKLASNTATVLTLAANITGLTSGGTYAYEIGGIPFSWDTPWVTSQLPFWQKRLEFLYVAGEATIAEVTMLVDLYLDFDLSDPARSFSFDLSAGGGLWGTGLWGTLLWSEGDATLTHARLRCAKTARAWRVRVSNHAPDTPITLLKIGMRSELLTDKR